MYTMVKQITFMKHKWLKNDDDKGGSMAEAISLKKENEIIMHSQTKKNGRAWTSILPEKIINSLDKNNGLYEVITHFPHKVYFDIDKHTEPNETFLIDIKNHILNYFPDAIMAVSGSITPEKTSYHLTLQNYVIHNENERLYMRQIVKHLNTLEESFDWKVYTKNRNMKCIFQSKDDGRVQQIIEDTDYKSHMITCYVTPYSLPFKSLPEEVRESVNIEKSKATFDLSILPKLKLTTPENIDFNNLNPYEILSLLPLDSSGKYNHDYTHLIARFCYFNDETFETFLSWIQKKHELTPDYVNKWSYHWKRMDKFPPVSIEKIKNILYYFYPNIKKDVHYRTFNDSFNGFENLKVKVETLSPACFVTNHKYNLLNTGMGSGKTSQTIDCLKNVSSFCWLAPNKALAHNTFMRLESSQININHYLEHNSKEKKEGILQKYNNMIIVLNSIRYLGKKNYDVIVIDEIETLIDKWFGTFMQNKKENWIVFIEMIRNAKKVIMLDAFITTKTIDFIKDIEANASIIVYERTFEPITRTVNYMPNFLNMVSNIKDDLKNGLKLFIFYPYKNQSVKHNEIVSMHSLHNMLQTETGAKGIYYNADIDEKIKFGLKNVNEEWSKFDFVITNAIITCGVNFENEHFNKEYIVISSFSSPRDVIQVSYRPRYLSSGIINVCYAGPMTQTNTWEDDCAAINCPIYSNMLKRILNEKKSPIKKTFQLFCSKANYKQTTDIKKIDEQLQKETNNMLEKYANGFAYLGIEDIDFSQAEFIQHKLFSGEATMVEKFMLQKYFFKAKFVEEAQNARFEGIYNSSSLEGEANVLEMAWNDQYIFFFESIRRYSNNLNNVFTKIKNHNNFIELFPTDKEFNKIKISEEIMKQIFTDFKFKYMTPSSSKKIIMKEIYNSYFGVKIICTEYDANKHTSFFTNEDSLLNKYITFVQKYNKIQLIPQELEPEFDADYNNECDFD